MKAKASPYYNDDIYLKESSVASLSMAKSPFRESELSLSRSPDTRIGHSPGGMPKMVQFTGAQRQGAGLYDYHRSDKALPKTIMKTSPRSPVRTATKTQSYKKMSYHDLDESMSRSRSRSKSTKSKRNNRTHQTSNDLGQSYMTDMNSSYQMTPGDRGKYHMQNDKVVDFYKKVLSDIRGTIQNERK